MLGVYHEFIENSEEQIKALALIGDKQAIAYLWIEAYAENLTEEVNAYNDDGGAEPISLEELVETGVSWLDPDSKWGGEYIIRGGTFEGDLLDPLFWDKLSDLLQIEIPDNKRNSFFSCSC